MGFLAGMFGKGGSAIATPLLYAVGVPAFVAVAAPLPATIPSTLVASIPYWQKHLLDRRVIVWSIAWGVPATVLGAFLSRWINGTHLVRATDILVALLGLRFALRPGEEEPDDGKRPGYILRLSLAAISVGFVSGLLANSGGILLAPLYLLALRLPVKSSFACSLAVAAVLAIPGTLVHWALGHIDWKVVFVFGAASIPLSYVGARVAVRVPSEPLERAYGIALTVIGAGLFFVHRI